jgi:hypothetical protein
LNYTISLQQGDSGGPLVIKIDGKWIISGVVSGGNECGRPNSPGIYTKVSSFNNWIKEVIYSRNQLIADFQSISLIFDIFFKKRQMCASVALTVSRTLTNLRASTNTIWINLRKVISSKYAFKFSGLFLVQTGAITWEQLLERRQKMERLLPTRTSNQKCPGGNVEFDEFNCLTTFLFERYQSSELISFK